MTRPWVVIVSGATVLVAIGVGIRHFRSADSDEVRVSRQQLAALTEATRTDRGGWIARPSGDASQPASRAGGLRSAPGSGAGSAVDRGSAVRAGGAAVPESGSGGSATVVTSGSGQRSTVGGLGTGSMPSGGDRIRANSAVPAVAVPFEGAIPLSRSAQEERLANNPAGVVPQGGAADKSEDPPQEGPVLSLPLEKSAEPAKGDVPVVQEGVTFESGQGATFSTDSRFVVPDGGNIRGEAGTVSFWMQPQWGGGDEGDASLVQLRDQDVWANRLQIFKNGRYLRFLFTDNSGTESNTAATVDGWNPGEWHHVTATWGEALQTFYVDGRMVGQQTYEGQLDVRPGTPLYIGSDLPRGGPSAGATLSQFQVYNRALPPSEVSNLANSRK